MGGSYSTPQTAEDTKRDDQLWAKQLNGAEVSHMQQEHEDQFAELTCCVCMCTPLDETDSTQAWIECHGCIGEDRYCCPDDKKAFERKHKFQNYDHKFDPRPVSSQLMIQTKHSGQLAKGRGEIREYQVLKRKREATQGVNRIKAAVHNAAMALAPSGAEAGKAIARNGWKAAVKTLKLRELARQAELQPNMVKHVGAAVALGLCAWEVMQATRTLAKSSCDRTAWKKFGRAVVYSVGKNLTTHYAGIQGFKAGASVGSYFGPYGTLIGGLIGAVLFGVLGQQFQDSMFQKWWPDPEEQQKKKFINEALAWFGFHENDVKNREIFNENEIRRRYRRRAKESHPDMKSGSAEAFLTLQTYFGALMTLWEETSGETIPEARLDNTIKAIAL